MRILDIQKLLATITTAQNFPKTCPFSYLVTAWASFLEIFATDFFATFYKNGLKLKPSENVILKKYGHYYLLQLFHIMVPNAFDQLFLEANQIMSQTHFQQKVRLSIRNPKHYQNL